MQSSIIFRSAPPLAMMTVFKCFSYTYISFIYCTLSWYLLSLFRYSLFSPTAYLNGPHRFSMGLSWWLVADKIKIHLSLFNHSSMLLDARFRSVSCWRIVILRLKPCFFFLTRVAYCALKSLGHSDIPWFLWYVQGILQQIHQSNKTLWVFQILNT